MKTLAITALLLGATPTTRAQAVVATVKLPYRALLTTHCVCFKPARHKLIYQPAGIIRTIDGQAFFGTDGEVPRSQLTSASVLLGGVRYQLPVGRMYNPWPWSTEPDAHDFRLRRLAGGRGYVLAGMFSDGAGGYAARWLLANGKATRLLLSQDEAYFW